MAMFGPKWWHHHGIKMRVEKLSQANKLLIITGSAASIRITSRTMRNDDGWYVKWEVLFDRDCKVNGQVWMATDNLRAAFGLSENSGKFGQWLIDRFGADSAEQGMYIRYKDYLNIPCPGTGHDGDPNVSILLDDKIKEAVSKLFEG